MEILTSFISGEYIHQVNNKLINIINPATEEIIYKADLADNNVIQLAIDSAKASLKTWRNTSAQNKTKIMLKTANALREHKKELASLEVSITGKPLSEALDVDIDSAADCLEYFAGLTDKIEGISQTNKESLIYTIEEPLGVCLGIGAWNYPLQIACWKAAPALAAGNAMIFKPSELTPNTALKLAEIFCDCGLPNGVFNVIIGDKATGDTITKHEEINKISLTGSIETGKKVMQNASVNLTPVTMELGGKSPFIVFDDAALNNATDQCILANFYTQGEICSNGTRVFVSEFIYDKFIDKLLTKMQDIKVGDPLDLSTNMGAIISKPQLDKILSYIKLGNEQGAKLLYGGNQINTKGYFIEPTIFAECTDEMKIVTDEIFGPVMSILKFRTEGEVIERANNTKFGLAAGVFTQDITRAHRVASKLQAGTCWINTYNLTPISMPFGGYKNSGIGRENGINAIKSYTQTKSIYVNLT